MMLVIYRRWTAGINDVREFRDFYEFNDWIVRQIRLEPTSVLGIYEKKDEKLCFDELFRFDALFNEQGL